MLLKCSLLKNIMNYPALVLAQWSRWVQKYLVPFIAQTLFVMCHELTCLLHVLAVFWVLGYPGHRDVYRLLHFIRYHDSCHWLHFRCSFSLSLAMSVSVYMSLSPLT